MGRLDSACTAPHLLREQLEDVHTVLAQALALLRRAHQVRDEAPPPRRPVVLQDLHQRVVAQLDPFEKAQTLKPGFSLYGLGSKG
jgi:hypothetical protein